MNSESSSAATHRVAAILRILADARAQADRVAAKSVRS
jgi:hypothetical protein